ncbi:hypothetical protein EI94DRAFT_1734111 [Lactarius quietus]|nr:hypothetical protein EI94DRAFT_1734111 [Lactarius quietus]
MGATPPPLGVKFTFYRLLNITAILSIGIPKCILSYKGLLTTPTTLDWVGGTMLAAVLYCVGLYESRDANKWEWIEWLFEFDLAPAIGYCTTHAVGSGLMRMSFFHSMLSALFMGLLIGNWFLYFLHLSDMCFSWPIKFKLLVIFGTAAILSLLFLGVGALAREVRAEVWSWHFTMYFDAPGARLPERYSQGALSSVSAQSLTISFRMVRRGGKGLGNIMFAGPS